MFLPNVEMKRKEFPISRAYVAGGKTYAWVEMVFKTPDLEGSFKKAFLSFVIIVCYCFSSLAEAFAVIAKMLSASLKKTP